MTLGDIEDAHLFVWPMYISDSPGIESDKYDYIPSRWRDVDVRYIYPSIDLYVDQMPIKTIKPCLCVIVDPAQWRKARGTK